MSGGHSSSPGSSSAGSSGGAAALVLIAGVVLAIGALVFAFVSTDDPARSIITGLVFLYPAAAYAIVRDDDPTNVLPPVPVTIAAGVVAGIVAVFSIGAGSAPLLDRTLFALFLVASIFFPAAAYTTGYGDQSVGPTPETAATGGITGGVLLLGATIASGAPGYGAGTALLVFLGGVVYAHSQGLTVSHRRQQQTLVVSLVLAFSFLILALTGYQSLGFVSIAIVVLLGPTGAVIFIRSRNPL